MNIVMKLTIVVLVVLSILFFAILYSPNSGMYGIAYKVNETPANDVKISMEELDNHPFVKKAVLQSGESIKVPFEEQKNVTFGDILFDNNTD
jgi:hypothetical protein